MQCTLLGLAELLIVLVDLISPRRRMIAYTAESQKGELVLR